MKKIKILTITLAIIAITMIAFLGIYTQVQNRMENQVKDYESAMDLKGSRNIRLTVNKEGTTTIKDAEGKVVENTENLTDEQIAEKGYTKEEVPNNKEEVKNVENYLKSKELVEKRLKKLGVENYSITLEEQTGDILIEIPENTQTDSIISNIKTIGKFEILDSETNDVLMDNNDIKTAKVMYSSGNGMTSGTSVYLEIEFDKEGRKKLEDISNQYVKKEDTSDQENENSEKDEAIDENKTEETDNANENKESTTEKKVTLKIDGEQIMSTSFEDPIKTGKLQLSIGSGATDSSTLQQYIEQASSMAIVLDTGKMPIQYDLGQNQYVLSDITQNEKEIAIYVVLAIIVVALIVLVARHKVLGVLGVISYVGFISIYMLIIRYANVVLSIEGILGIIMALLLNYLLVNKLLAKANDRMTVYKEFFVKIIPIIILVITFCFIRWVPISSFGMAMFWGIFLIIAYNNIVTNILLKIQTGKEK